MKAQRCCQECCWSHLSQDNASWTCIWSFDCNTGICTHRALTVILAYIQSPGLCHTHDALTYPRDTQNHGHNAHTLLCKPKLSRWLSSASESHLCHMHCTSSVKLLKGVYLGTEVSSHTHLGNHTRLCQQYLSCSMPLSSVFAVRANDCAV